MALVPTQHMYPPPHMTHMYPPPHMTHMYPPPHMTCMGQVVSVRPGERVPVDGVVVSGASLIDQANLTGESRPVCERYGSGSRPLFLV